MTIYTTSVAALALLLGTAHGHMVMTTPTSFNLHGTAKLLQVDPLGAFPFPCQGMFDVVETTSITAGNTQTVKVDGGAQHGGGSCQFSLTYENPPPADKSKWKTIYTIIGGCPVQAETNLPVTGLDADGRAQSLQCGNDSGVECIRQFDIPIPKELPNGNATFAWTWYNKIGNREVYMNCAPVTISGGAGNQQFFEDLPPLFLANVPGECTTGNGVFNIPNPGRYGRILEQPAPGNEGSCPKADLPTFEGGSGSGSGGGGNGSGGGSSVVPPPAPSSSAPPVACPPPSSSGFITQTVPASASPTSVVAAPAPSATNGGGGAGTVPPGGQPCPENGAIICFSPTSFGLCANGVAIPQPVAPGTTTAGIRKANDKFLKPNCPGV
ncbi:uncharacterized protein B0H64DRAFT_436069 [Chaetomium fimeti]|uniref:Lytic polysaccharide monooxygenase n=1 Tax=Chaetomium fimeti TaxID=1854472 RepID=A0AAE0H760_9PEZI|nr:hypothetical protein B0H64DRAFT_436069 [Chaetomium fimeti]